MPTWRNTLPPEGKHQGFQLRRTPQSGAVHAIITCEDILVVDTHYWHGRTTPCERQTNALGDTIDDSTCTACREKIGYRTHVYVTAYDPKKSEHFLFECTTHAAKPLAEYHDAVKTLRGCVIHATRPKGTPNGKVAIETGTANLQKVALPQPPDVPMALAVIWRLPLAAIATQTETTAGLDTPDGHRRRKPTTRIETQPISQQREQENNAGAPTSIGEILKTNRHRREPAISR